MTLDEAIDIAWGSDRYRSIPRPANASEALRMLDEVIRGCGFNWITGQVARDVLVKAIGTQRADYCPRDEPRI